VRYPVPSLFNWSLPTALVSKDTMTAVVTKVEIGRMAFVVTRMFAQNLLSANISYLVQ
jgi:hypothetical protein